MDNLAGHKQSRRFLRCTDGNCLTSVDQWANKGRCSAGPCIYHQGSTGKRWEDLKQPCIYQERKILKGGSKAKSRISVLNFMRTDFNYPWTGPLNGIHLGSSHEGYSPRKKSYMEQLVEFYGLRTIHLDEQKVKKKQQEICIGEQGDSN